MNDPKEPTVHPVVALFLLVAVLMLVLFLGYIAYKVVIVSTETLPLLAIGMLGDPFRTTRKMRVPYRSRAGHRERAFGQFVKFIFFLMGIMLLSLFCAKFF